jgi:hypothetical protein
VQEPGRHEELVAACVGGVDLLVVHDADLHLIERHRVVHEPDERHHDPLQPGRLRRIDAAGGGRPFAPA